MEEKKITVQVRMRFEWQENSASRLRKPIENLIAMLPQPTYASGSVVQAPSAASDFEQQTDFSEIQQWLDALGEPAASYRLYLNYGPQSALDLTISATGSTVGIRGAVADAAEFRAKIQQFATSAGLKASPATRTPPASKPAPLTPDFRRRRSYRLLEEVTADEWLRAVDQLYLWLGEKPSFHGTLELKADPGTSQEIRDVQRWKKDVAEHWADLAAAGINANQPSRSVYLQVQFTDQMVNLNLAAEEGQSVAEEFSAFEKALPVALQSTAASDAKFLEERRRYYTVEPVTADWVRTKLIALLARIGARRTGFSGTFRVADQGYIVQDFTAWTKEVELRWEELQAAGCWLSTADSTQSVDVDFEREQVTVNLRSLTGISGSAAMTFADYESALNLERAPSVSYQNYRFANRYELSSSEAWDTRTDQALAAAIDEAISVAFEKYRRYVFVSGSLTMGVAEQEQTSSRTKDEFLQQLRSGGYVSARIYLQGPKGYDLAVQLERSEKKVTLRSSIPPQAKLFKSVAKPFDNIRGLNLIKAENRNAAGEEQKEAPWLKTWLLPLLTSVAVVMAGWFFNTLPTLKSSTQILAPRESETISAPSSPVQWIVTRKTLHGETSEMPHALVQVRKEGDPRYIPDIPDATSGISIPFPSEGVYFITVSAPSVPTQNVRVTVKFPAPSPK